MRVTTLKITKVSINNRNFCTVVTIDNALAGKVGFRFSQDSGRFLENMVFLELKRREKELYYFADKNECDFAIREGAGVTEVLQVAHNLDTHNEKREIGGLLEAMEKFDLKSGTILTNDQEGLREIGGRKIAIKPVWKWSLER